MDGLTNIELLRKFERQFHLHPLALKDVLITAQRPQVEYYTDHFFIISEMVYEEPDRKIALEQLSVLLGDSYVLTLQESNTMSSIRSVHACASVGVTLGR